MWKAFQDFVASSTNPQNPAVQEDADLQAAINASLGVTSGPSASPRSHDEDSLLQQAIAESKREFEQKALDTTITDIKALCTDLQLFPEMMALLEKNYPLYIKDCPNNSASLKKMDFKALLIAFRRLPEVEQDIIKVHMSESLEKEKGSVANQFNLFLNLQGDPKKSFKDLLFAIEAQSAPQSAVASASVPAQYQPEALPPKVAAPILVDEEDAQLKEAMALSMQAMSVEPSSEQSISVGKGKSQKRKAAQQSKPLEVPSAAVPAHAQEPAQEKPQMVAASAPANERDAIRLQRILALSSKQMKELPGIIALVQERYSSSKEQMALVDAFLKSHFEGSLAGMSAFIVTYQPNQMVTPALSAKIEASIPVEPIISIDEAVSEPEAKKPAIAKKKEKVNDEPQKSRTTRSRLSKK